MPLGIGAVIPANHKVIRLAGSVLAGGLHGDRLGTRTDDTQLLVDGIEVGISG